MVRWLLSVSDSSLDRRGKPLTMELTGTVEPCLR
ncbi:MAG: DUF3297 family protein [Roseomonas sp.]|nr:DUF3297 family protein [Roseomonas sp.]